LELLKGILKDKLILSLLILFSALTILKGITFVLSSVNWNELSLLFSLVFVTAGVYGSGVLDWAAEKLLERLGNSYPKITLTLVVISLISGYAFMNDTALLILVPLCLKMLGLDALALVLIIAAAIAYQWALNSGLQKLPLDIETVSASAEEVELVRAKWRAAQADGELTLSVRDWSLLNQNLIEESIEKGKLLEGSSISIGRSADDWLVLKLSLGFPRDGEAPAPYAGRFINVQATGSITIEDGQVTSFDTVYYRWGSVFDSEDLKGEVAVEVGGRLLSILNDLILEVDLDHLKVLDDGRIRVTWEQSRR